MKSAPPAATNRPSEWSASDGAWHLVVRDGGPDKLYYLPADPSEEHDLSAASPVNPSVARLRASIAEMRRVPKPDLRKFRSLGYVQ